MQAKELVDLLGHEHDLGELTAFIDQKPRDFGEGEGPAVPLRDAIARRRLCLRRESLERAALLFSDTAKTEAGIIDTLWRRAAA